VQNAHKYVERRKLIRAGVNRRIQLLVHSSRHVIDFAKSYIRRPHRPDGSFLTSLRSTELPATSNVSILVGLHAELLNRHAFTCSMLRLRFTYYGKRYAVAKSARSRSPRLRKKKKRTVLRSEHAAVLSIKPTSWKTAAPQRRGRPAHREAQAAAVS